MRADSNDDYGANYLQAEAIIGKLMHHDNEDRLHATLGYMTPATWHRGQLDQVRDERARRLAAGPCTLENHESAAIDSDSLSSESLPSSHKPFVHVDVKRDILMEIATSGWELAEAPLFSGKIDGSGSLPRSPRHRCSALAFEK